MTYFREEKYKIDDLIDYLQVPPNSEFADKIKTNKYVRMFDINKL